jgi:hypothetical protein
VKLVGAILVVTVAVACAPDDRNHGPYPKENAANAVKPTDKTAEGQWYFLHETWGAEQTDEYPPADFMLSLMNDEPATFGNQFAKYGFVSDENDDFPVGLKRGTVDKGKVHETCALCHFSVLDDGRRWMGLPNRHLDIGRFRADVNDRWIAAGHESFLDAASEAKMRVTGPGRFEASPSDLAVALPVALPNYITLGDGAPLNYMGTSRDVRTEASFSLFVGFDVGHKTDKTNIPFPSDGKLNAFLDFFGAMNSPTPPSQDAGLVAKGKDVFHEARCDACHHLGNRKLDAIIPTPHNDLADRIPGDDPSFPRGSIGTDRLHRVLFDGTGNGGGNDIVDFDLIAFVIGHGLSAGDSDGYRSSDLRGLVFTAPYLHNDSVPTLEDLLSHADERPATFVRDGFLVDTFAAGNSNAGHEFGADLSTDDKAALIAFLKTL